MDALVHAVGLQRFVKAASQLLAAEAKLHRDRLRALEQPVEMAVEERELPLVDAQALPDAVPQHEAAVEHGNDGLASRHQLAVHVDQDRRVPRVRDVVHRLRHG